MSGPAARELIRQNYDPQATPQRNDLRILVTTDTLAEGVNLHRANVVVNYDLPWNPTRVLQRVGRVNRVGTAFDRVYIFNFFPTAQSDEHLGLEANIKAKIQAFHDILGEDARYLTEEEVISQHELFGDRLYNALNRKESYLGEEEARSELEYLQAIRRCATRSRRPSSGSSACPRRRVPGGLCRSRRTSQPSDSLVSFFRRGRLKKFYTCAGDAPVELTFLDAADRLRCEPDTPRLPIPAGYYDLLDAQQGCLCRGHGAGGRAGAAIGRRPVQCSFRRQLSEGNPPRSGTDRRGRAPDPGRAGCLRRRHRAQPA